MLTCAVVAALMATVLFANGGRNILALSKAFHIDLNSFRIELSFRRPSKPAAAPAGGTVLPTAGTTGWPWRLPPAEDKSALQLHRVPADICNAMAEDGPERPSFTTRENGTWECSTFREHAASSVFVQMRGLPDGSFSSFRIKFNLDADGMTESLGDEAARLVAAGIRPLATNTELEAALIQKLMSQTDFYFLLGYYPVTFKREFGEASRFNMIAVNPPGLMTGLPPRAIPTVVKADADQDIRAGKGARRTAAPRGP